MKKISKIFFLLIISLQLFSLAFFASNNNNEHLQEHDKIILAINNLPRPTMKSVDVREQKIKQYLKAIVEKYPHNVDNKTARMIVETAMKYEHHEFPRTVDIIAIIDIESSFRSNVKSSLTYDPAVGLMQVRPGIWKIKKEELNDIEGQITHGVRILKEYYEKTGNIHGAVMAYNIGITSYRNGKRNYNYLAKYRQEVQRYYTLVYANLPISLTSK